MKRPRLVGAIAEPIRAGGELATSVGLAPFLRLLPAGDGHPVMVLPGFMASDASTRPLRAFLSGKGYAVSGWSLGRNLGPTSEVMASLPAAVRSAVSRHGREVSVVGWSLGGIYARWLARMEPDCVRFVVTLGSPVRPEVETASNAQALFDYLRPYHSPDHPSLDDGEPLPVPATAIHTRTDGIVAWESCLIRDSPQSENIRVAGSHTGLGFNPAALYVVADRLAQPQGRWRPLQVKRWARGVVTPVRGGR